MSRIATTVTELVEPLLVPLGLDLFDIEYTGGTVRILVHKAEGAVDMESIELATRLISRTLDEEDPVPGAYTLEVSSPGLERNLRTPRHFAGAVGSDVTVKLHSSAAPDGQRRLRGKLTDAGEETVTLLTDAGDLQVIPLTDIDKARTIFEWGPAPKPGARPGKAPSRKPVAHRAEAIEAPSSRAEASLTESTQPARPAAAPAGSELDHDERTVAR